MSKRNVVHVEIPAANGEAAGKFYAGLFGWKLQHIPDMNYTLWEAADGTGGGFPQISKENPAGQVLVYIGSDDIETDLMNVEKLGGKILYKKQRSPVLAGWGGFRKIGRASCRGRVLI